MTREHLSTLQGSERTERGNLSMQKSVERRSVLKKNNLQANLEAKRCIKSALLDLLKKKSYDEIRMTDIINKSGVSRTCVYNNYNSKDEIMLDLYSKTIETVLSLRLARSILILRGYSTSRISTKRTSVP